MRRPRGPASAFLGAISSRMGLYAIAVVIVPAGRASTRLARHGDALHLHERAGPARLDRGPHHHPADLYRAAAARRALSAGLARHRAGRLHAARPGDGQRHRQRRRPACTCSTTPPTQAALFMSVFAVVHRTGTTDLNKLGGLVARMPLSFLVMLFGIIGLAGLPPMNGFVSKWMVYRSLMHRGRCRCCSSPPSIGTLGTILSVYKLIHNMFLGQLRVEHEHDPRGAAVHADPHARPVRHRLRHRLHARAGAGLGGRGAGGPRPAGGRLHPGRRRRPARRPGHDLAGGRPDGRLRRRRPALLRRRRQVQAGPPARQLCRRALPDRRRALPVQRQLLRRADAPDRPLVPRCLPLAGGGRRLRAWTCSSLRHARALPSSPTPLFLLATTVAVLAWALV